MHDILEPLASEQARAKYLDKQMRHMKSVRLPSSIPTSDDIPLEDGSLSGRIQDYCSRIENHQRCERDNHYVTLNSIKEYKAKQRQQGKRDRDEIYNKMAQNLEKVREVARSTLSRASTISAEEHHMALSETDFVNIKEKMNKIDQRIDGLYQNWQAECTEAITTEQCEEIQKFYEPYVLQYEFKYKVLYQILKQAISKQSKVPSARVSSAGLTPSLVALKDASTLQRKEQNRVEHGEDTPHMYSTIDGRLTPTAPVYEDMRMGTPLQVTPDGSQEGLSAAMGGTEDVQVTQLFSDKAQRPISTVTSPATEVPETSPKVIHEGHSQNELPGRNDVSRETSRADALAATRHFFSTVTERRDVPKVPITSTATVPQIDAPSASSTHDEVEPTKPETSSARTFLPSGSPPRPTTTATCRPHTWVQCISKGQIEEHSREDEYSVESEP